MSRKRTRQNQEGRQAAQSVAQLRQENQTLKAMYQELVGNRMTLENTFQRMQAAFFALAAGLADEDGQIAVPQEAFEAQVLNVSFELDEDNEAVVFTVVIIPDDEDEEDDE